MDEGRSDGDNKRQQRQEGSRDRARKTPVNLTKLLRIIEIIINRSKTNPNLMTRYYFPKLQDLAYYIILLS